MDRGHGSTPPRSHDGQKRVDKFRKFFQKNRRASYLPPDTVGPLGVPRTRIVVFHFIHLGPRILRTMRRSFVLTTSHQPARQLGLDHHHPQPLWPLPWESYFINQATALPLQLLCTSSVIFQSSIAAKLPLLHHTAKPWFPRPETHFSMTQPQTRQQQSLCFSLLQRLCPPLTTSSMHSQSL